MKAWITASYAVACALASLLRVAHAEPAPQPDPPALTVQQWEQDLDAVVAAIDTRHAAPYLRITRDTFFAKVKAFRRQLPGLGADAIFVGMDQLENTIGDGHTHFRLPADSPLYPLRFDSFGPEFRLIAVADDGPEASELGTRLVSIDGHPISGATKQLLTLTPAAETEPLRFAWVADMLSNGMVLHGLGLAKRRDVVRYTFEHDDGKRTTLEVRARSANQIHGWHSAVHTPLATKRNPQDGIACEPLGSSSTLYCNFHNYKNLQVTAQRMLEQIKTAQPARLVIDLRGNAGGDYCEGLAYIVNPVRQLPALNREGHLFVLIGPRTFSAAMANAVHFRQLTRAVLVGEPIGETPNSYQEAVDIILPNSHWTARISTRHYQFVAGGKNLVEPDKGIVRRWSDYAQGRDAVLDWIRALPADAQDVRQPWPDMGTKPLESAICEE